MAQHVFIVMPFGEKEGINFNQIYLDLIKPALLQVGLEPFRADEEILPGDIRADMFQELLMADLVIADLSISNANAWYELGVRHGLRSHGIVQIRSGETSIPFDVCVDRTLHYHLKKGAPDPDFIETDREALGKVALETLRSNPYRQPVSPVYQYLPYLQEPDWKSLRVKNADAFWHEHDQWANLIEVSRKNQKPGDILVLADEAPTYALKLEGYRTAGNALLNLGQFDFALEQFDKALAINPDDLGSAQKKGIVLGRLDKTAQAEQWLRALSIKHPHDAETWALLGRTEKDFWVRLWREEDKSPKDMFDDAAYESAQLKEAIQAYRQGFIEQPESYYAGINALTLAYLFKHLQEHSDNESELEAMAGGVRWATISELTKEVINQPNYWARVTLADLELLVSDMATIEKAYKYAITAARQDWFALDSSRQQLTLLQDLAFRPTEVAMAIALFDRAIAGLEKPKKEWQPRKVFLFTGHMIDAPEREVARFPKEKEPAAVDAIRNQLTALGAGPEDLALCGGTCGGDLIFAEAALELKLHLEVRIPFDIPGFLQNSVSFAGDNWQERFYQVKQNPNTTLLIMPDELGQLPENANPYERNNLWQLYSALSWGAEKVHCLCLWDGKGGDGPGGTKHMHDAVKQRSGQVHVLDTKTLFKITTGD
jgi:tetratricopeptide (TPR) repeat protein